MDDMIREMSNMKNQIQAMKLKLEEKEKRIQLLEGRCEELEKSGSGGSEGVK
jgi:predicted RNase H-like nuclease (RuvC/YqgF family)